MQVDAASCLGKVLDLYKLACLPVAEQDQKKIAELVSYSQRAPDGHGLTRASRAEN